MQAWRKYLLTELAAGVILALLLRRFVCLLAHVKGRSMQDTLQNGEVVFALRRRQHGRIRRFDVVLCRYPNRKGYFVKRVVGLPGEMVAIVEDVLQINGEPVEENFPRRRCLRDMAERQLDTDEYFVLGDNRPASRDSRSIGPIRRKDIAAVCKCVLFPIGRIRKIH